MSKQNDGGPAFPACNEAWNNDTMGMSLRDYFATHLQMHPDAIGPRTAEAVMGEPLPVEKDPLTLLKWWANAEARLRYIHADAMLRARQS